MTALNADPVRREKAERVIVKWLDSLIADDRCEAEGCNHPLPCPQHSDGTVCE